MGNNYVIDGVKFALKTRLKTKEKITIDPFLEKIQPAGQDKIKTKELTLPEIIGFLAVILEPKLTPWQKICSLGRRGKYIRRKLEEVDEMTLGEIILDFFLVRIMLSENYEEKLEMWKKNMEEYLKKSNA